MRVVGACLRARAAPLLQQAERGSGAQTVRSSGLVATSGGRTESSEAATVILAGPTCKTPRGQKRDKGHAAWLCRRKLTHKCISDFAYNAY
jgi:hypothetical protein